jgi:1-acyl-sn-glycerol-3-phosphate acyltransferase
MSTDPTDDSPAALAPWSGLGPGDLLRWPLDHLANPADRILLRVAAGLARHQVRDIVHWERVLPGQDPFILAANHGSRRETVYLTAALMLARGGRPVHFLADWNFRLFPGVGYLYTHSGAITVTRKEAHPRILNRLKPWFAQPTPPLEQARARLLARESVALFPEGRINRHPGRLLRGRFGAARLSLETGTPVLPVGIRFLGPVGSADRTDSSRPMEIRIGDALIPPADREAVATIAAVRAWHATLMSAVADLCGKEWSGDAPTRVPAPKPTPSPTTKPFALSPGGPPC